MPQVDFNNKKQKLYDLYQYYKLQRLNVKRIYPTTSFIKKQTE
jgi:hypothetical protein